MTKVFVRYLDGDQDVFEFRWKWVAISAGWLMANVAPVFVSIQEDA